MESLQEYLDGYMAIKFGSSLRSKLQKEYWKKDVAKGLPLIIAIADFHRIGTEETPSMTYTHSALAPYLYGFKSLVVEDENGNYQAQYTPIEKHTYLSKEIPSGYFNLPGAENISAVLFCNAGTIAKFNRMGVLAGYGLPNYQYTRSGQIYDMSDPVATEGIPRNINIEADDYHENWSDELELYHNPNAKYPLPPDYFQNINQHFSEGDRIRTRGYSTWIYSMTSMIEIQDE